ncbi:MAG: pilus assembly protein PilM [Zetaproteobacteria bacterium]|nr:pilus assembly protein PilM [Zetaproteobacteria bacterium]
MLIPWNQWFRALWPQKHAIAVVLLARGLYIVEVALANGLPKVVHFIFEPAPINADVLKQKLHSLSLYYVRYMSLVPFDSYQIPWVDAPDVPDDELADAVRWKVKDDIKFPVENAVVEVLRIPSSGHDTFQRVDSLYAVVSNQETLHKQLRYFEEAGVQLEVLDIPDLAQRNLATLFESPELGLAMLWVGDDNTLLTINYQGELLFRRHMLIGLKQLMDVQEAVGSLNLERLLQETLRTLNIFGRQFDRVVLSRLMVSAPQQLHIDRQLQQRLSLRVEWLDLASVIDLSSVPMLHDGEQVSHALPALGLALRALLEVKS